MYSGNDLGNDLGNDYFSSYTAEILSPGELLRPLTIEQLENLSYKPKSRNKVIVDVLLRKRLMEWKKALVGSKKQGITNYRIKGEEMLSQNCFNNRNG